MREKIQKHIDRVTTNLKVLEDASMRPWDKTKKNNDDNFTHKVEKQRQYYFGMIQGLELALDAIK